MRDKVKTLANLQNIGKKRAEVLTNAGFDSPEKIKNADFTQLKRVPSIGFKIAYQLKNGDIEYVEMKELKEKMTIPVKIGNVEIQPIEWLLKPKEIKLQPEEFKLEDTTVWSFPQRGKWATHTPDYRGNWSPQVVRNLILRYSKKGDTVLDPMVGGGTTQVECLLTGRNSIGIDINRNAALVTKNRLDFLIRNFRDKLPKTEHRVFVGDARNMNLIEDGSIDFIATHPPYANIIQYGELVDGDLSAIPDFEIYVKEMGKVAKEMYRVLKNDGYAAVLLGDTHRNSYYVPIAYRVMLEFLRVGFVLKEDIIKIQWNCKSDARWKNRNKNFLLVMHEHLFVFHKTKRKLKNSSISFFKLG